MVSTKGPKSSSRILPAIVLLLLFGSGCTIGRVYMGSEIREDPKKRIEMGLTTKAEVLEIFGPPDLIQRQSEGGVFVYAYVRKNSTKFTVEEPLITNITFFEYTRIQEKKDSLVILFDKTVV